MPAFDQLLVVQSHDTHLQQLEHKRANLPARATLVEAQQALNALAAESAETESQRGELSTNQRHLELEVAGLEEKIEGETAKLYAGSVTGVKELQALQDEIASLKRRQGDLEDQVIELMEAGEPLDTELEAFAVRRGEIEAQIGSVEQEIADAEAAIDAEMATERADRVTAADGIDAGLLATYDKIRENTGGVGVAKFVGGRCEGCHLSLPAMEVDQIKKQPADALVTCSSCERILVR